MFRPFRAIESFGGTNPQGDALGYLVSAFQAARPPEGVEQACVATGDAERLGFILSIAGDKLTPCRQPIPRGLPATLRPGASSGGRFSSDRSGWWWRWVACREASRQLPRKSRRVPPTTLPPGPGRRCSSG